MNYSWNWGVLLQSTGIGDTTYLNWIMTGIGWLAVIAIVAWSIAMLLGSLLGIMPYPVLQLGLLERPM